MEQLGGELSLATEPGRGTTFTLCIPLTIAVIDAFTVRCGGERFLVPVTVVEEVLELDPARLVEAPRRGGRRAVMLQRRGEAVSVVELADALGMPPVERGLQAIVVAARARTSWRSRSSASSGSRRASCARSRTRWCACPASRARRISATARPRLVLDLVLAIAGLVADRGRAA